MGKSKDKIALVLSILALVLSVFATVTTERRAIDEKYRSIRNQLTEVLGRLTSLSVEYAKLMHEAKDDGFYQQNVSAALGQQNGFLLDQASYLADQIPDLVTTYEFNTIASASEIAGNLLAAEKYHLKAIEVAHSDLYKSQAIRSYAALLFSQRRFEAGRKQFNKALALLKNGDNITKVTNGITYQIWALNEQHVALSREEANNLYEKARVEFSGIDIELMRNQYLQGLKVAQSEGSPTPPPPNFIPQAETVQGTMTLKPWHERSERR